MLTEFVSLQLSREELKEIHVSLLQSAIIEEEIRRERGQERTERRPLLERIEALLGESEKALHYLDHETEDNLWEYAWYAFTDEWAWYRAAQDTEKEADTPKSQDDTAFQKRIEQRYQKNFDAYVSEIDMHEAVKKAKKAKSQPKIS